MMGHMGGMMWGMGLFWLIVLIVLVLGAAALVKICSSAVEGGSTKPLPQALVFRNRSNKNT
jgi:type IV secretory pathway VirB2 component (pilin)